MGGGFLWTEALLTPHPIPPLFSEPPRPSESAGGTRALCVRVRVHVHVCSHARCCQWVLHPNDRRRTRELGFGLGFLQSPVAVPCVNFDGEWGGIWEEPLHFCGPPTIRILSRREGDAAEQRPQTDRPSYRARQARPQVQGKVALRSLAAGAQTHGSTDWRMQLLPPAPCEEVTA